MVMTIALLTPMGTSSWLGVSVILQAGLVPMSLPVERKYEIVHRTQLLLAGILYVAKLRHL